MAATETGIDEARLQEFVGRFVGDLGAALHQTTVIIGDKLGLYAAMGDGEPVTAAELAGRTGTEERYVREWLCAQAASGYAEYDPDGGRFFLTPEQAACLSDRESPSHDAERGVIPSALSYGKARAGAAPRTAHQPPTNHRPTSGAGRA
ncbi:MAG: hypothetical protein ACRDPC_05565 [Solirubrobacteraceae bacterium]